MILPIILGSPGSKVVIPNVLLAHRWSIGRTFTFGLTIAKTIRKFTMGGNRILEILRCGLAQIRLRTTVLKSEKEMCTRDKDVDYSVLSIKKIH